MQFVLEETFIQELPIEPLQPHSTRRVEVMGSFVMPHKLLNPILIHSSTTCGELIGLTKEDLESEEFLELVSGAKIVPNSHPYAMNYGGHQFGNWAGQLGDGRAITILEILYQQKKFSLQLKGSGLTPYSRQGDGKAVMRSSLREYLCSEAMFWLGVPTTRAISLIKTGEKILRDIHYNGNAEFESGAIVCRVAESFVRFGHFELWAARGDTKSLKLLADYIVKHHFQELNIEKTDVYIELFQSIATKTLEMMLHWQSIGFVHGVMNTDNMSILGLSIDYGPFGFLEEFDAYWTPNTSDTDRRYCYQNQPKIAQWNLYQIANALFPLIQELDGFQAILDDFEIQFTQKWIAIQNQKIGLYENLDSYSKLQEELQTLMNTSKVDYTIFYRELSELSHRDSIQIYLERISKSFYIEIDEETTILWENWLGKYHEFVLAEKYDISERTKRMKALNPKYILRNYMLQIAIEGVENNDFTILEELYDLLQKPYDDNLKYQHWYTKRPSNIVENTLSCSS